MELMFAITEYNYFKPAAGVPAEKSIHNPYFDYERNKKMYKYHRNRRYCRNRMYCRIAPLQLGVVLVYFRLQNCPAVLSFGLN